MSRIEFSRAELLELRRALKLIMQEDEACNVNMDAASVNAKESALQKLTKRTGRSKQELDLDQAESVSLSEITGPDRPFGKR